MEKFHLLKLKTMNFHVIDCPDVSQPDVTFNNFLSCSYGVTAGDCSLANVASFVFL